MNTLFVCYTPLHALQAVAIIQAEGLENSSVVYLAAVDNTKHRHYFAQCARLCKHSLYQVTGNNLITLGKIAKQCRRWLNSQPCEFYTGNLKKFTTRFLLSLIKPARICTFDDGINNIAGQGYLYSDQEFWMSRLWFFWQPRYRYRILRTSIERHYSLYDLPNVYGSARKIALFPASSVSRHNTSKTVLLGNPLTEDRLLALSEERALCRNLIMRFHAELYLPHPRERFAKTPDETTVINTELVAEDYLYALSRDQRLQVIGIGSSALLHLHEYDNIGCLNVQLAMGEYQGRVHADAVAGLFARAGISTVKIESLN